MSVARPIAAGLTLAAFASAAAAQTPTPQPTVEPVVTTLTLFAGTLETLWRSKDWGASWERVSGLSPGGGLAKQPPLTEVRTIHPTGSRVYVGEDPERDQRAIAMGRQARPEEQAGAILFLLSDLSSYITGQTILVDGGLNLRWKIGRAHV